MIAKKVRLALRLAALCVGVCVGCLDPSGPLPQPVGPEPSPAPTPVPRPVEPITPGHTDAEFWRALADRVAAGRVPSTDRLILILKEAKSSGDVRDAERVAEVLPDIAEQPQQITESNRERIATSLRKLTRTNQ